MNYFIICEFLINSLIFVCFSITGYLTEELLDLEIALLVCVHLILALIFAVYAEQLEYHTEIYIVHALVLLYLQCLILLPEALPKIPLLGSSIWFFGFAFVFFQAWLVLRFVFYWGVSWKMTVIQTKDRRLAALMALISLMGLMGNFFYWIQNLLFVKAGMETALLLSSLQLMAVSLTIAVTFNLKGKPGSFIPCLLSYYTLFGLASALNTDCHFWPEGWFQWCVYVSGITFSFASITSNFFWCDGIYAKSLQHLTVILAYCYARNLLLSWGGYYSINRCDEEFQWNLYSKLGSIAFLDILYFKDIQKVDLDFP